MRLDLGWERAIYAQLYRMLTARAAWSLDRPAR
jgi:hypothetical protein